MNDGNAERDRTPAADSALRLEQSIAELTEAIRARDEFISIAAHELRNPMQPILGQVERLQILARRSKTPLPPPIVASIEFLHEAVEVFIRRATALLDVNRIVSGALNPQPIAIDISDLVTRLARRHAPEAAKLECRFTVAVEPGLAAYADPLAVGQILDNLVSNAMKYGAGAPIELGLEDHGDKVALIVRDHGPGIPPADRDRIFARFERVVATSHHGGFGIGLWVVGQLVAAMHGSITVDSTLGRGSTFTVTLPKPSRAGGERS